MPPQASDCASPSARKRLKPDERRSQILDVAVAFFAEVGLDGRTRDLSERAGITQSLLYNYFGSKEALIEAVFERVYLDRLQPEWRVLLTDRAIPLSERMQRFYEAYTRVIFTYEWMRIFMFAGLAGAKLNLRYLAHLRTSFLEPMLAEISASAAPDLRAPDMEDIWALHGAIVYIGIRRYVYQVPTPEDDAPHIARAIAGFLRGFGIATAGEAASPCQAVT
ncbi:MAG: TetR/AcrR family transcriptional regulator [Proteobacteria bacterium]|nr:TetR/AcrR family transcriptional regulator [Pseudomonadota bacterium]